MTDIYELSRHHLAVGGAVTVVLSRGVVEGYEPYRAGALEEVAFGDLPGRNQKVLDSARGAVGLARQAVIRTYAAALDAIPHTLDGHVFVHNAPGTTAALARARPDVPICLYAHNTLFRTYTKREARRVIEASHRVLCVSDFIADEIRRKIGRPDEGIRTVRNGVDADAFTPGPARAPHDPPVILFLGRVIPQKGVDLL